MSTNRLADLAARPTVAALGALLLALAFSVVCSLISITALAWVSGGLLAASLIVAFGLWPCVNEPPIAPMWLRSERQMR